MKPSRTNGFVIGEWTVTPSLNLIARGDEQTRVEPRVMDALAYLAERSDQIVSKEELIARVWDGRFVSDDVLTVTISVLRKALGDDARHPRYIETVSRRGYRLIAPVQPVAPSGFITHVGAGYRRPNQGNTPGDETGPTTSAVQAIPQRSRQYSWAAMAALVTFAIVVASAAWMLAVTRTTRHVPTADAHEAYVKGRYFLDQRSVRGWRQALQHFERVVALDPQYPAGQAGLADTYTAMSDFGIASPAEMRPRAMQAAERALDLDPRSAEGHAALGRAQLLFDWDFAAAERSLKRSIALDPEYMPAYQGMAWLTSARGQAAEAIAAARRALQIDPVNTARYLELAWVLALGGRHEDAMREVERALQLNPRSFEAFLMKGWVLEQSGQSEAAYAAFRETLQIVGAADQLRRRLDAGYRTGGLPGYYRVLLDERSGGMPMSSTWRAQLYARVGEFDRAIESLEQAYQKREGALAWVNVEPSFSPLRSDARFQQIAARVTR